MHVHKQVAIPHAHLPLPPSPPRFFPDKGLPKSIFYEWNPIENLQELITHINAHYDSIGTPSKHILGLVNTVLDNRPFKTQISTSLPEVSPEDVAQLCTGANIPLTETYAQYIENCIFYNAAPALSLIPDALYGGFDVVANAHIPKNSFIGIYAGEINTLSLGPQTPTEYASIVPDHHATDTLKTGQSISVIDATSFGNHTRFINTALHPDDNNVAPEWVTYATIPVMALLATRDITPGQSLLADYGIEYALQIRLSLPKNYPNYHNIQSVGHRVCEGLAKHYASQKQPLDASRYRVFAQLFWENL